MSDFQGDHLNPAELGGPIPFDLPLPRRVLVADPDDHSRALVASTLSDDGWLVTEVADESGLARGVAGLDMAMTPDLVVTAQHMPGGNAVEVMVTLREAGFQVPFVLLTDTPDGGAALEARRAGAVAVFGRPFSPWLLREKVRSVFDDGLR